MGWAFMAANATDSLLFVNDVAADRSVRMNSEVYRAILSVSYLAKGYKTDWMVLHRVGG